MENQDMNLQQPTGKQKKSWSTGAKVLLGCGIGCGLFALLVVLSCGGFWIWLFHQSALPVAERLIGPDTTAMAIIRIDSADPGARQMIEKIGDSIDKQRYQGMPPEMQKFLQRFGRGNTAEGLKRLLPVQLVWTASYATPKGAVPAQMQNDNEPSNDRHVLIISTKFGGILKMVSWMISKAAQSDASSAALKYNGHNIIVNSEGKGAHNYVAIVENNVVFSNNLETTKSAIDRLKDQNATFEGQGSLKKMFEKLSHDREAIGVITNEHGEIRRFLKLDDEEGQVNYDEIEVMGWEADIISSDVVKLTLYVDCRNEETAKKIQLNIVRLLLQERLKTGRVSEVKQKRDGLSVRVEFEISGLEKQLEGLGKARKM